MATITDKPFSSLIKEKALELGFDLCGIAVSKKLKEKKSILNNWCLSGMNGEMSYLGRNIDKRIDPSLLFPGAKSVIVTGLNYYTESKQGGNGVPVVSRYAYGTNYHDVISGKLDKLLDYIKGISPESDGQVFVDSAPILEKAWAQEAGLGWQGRHSILINKEIGSFFFLGIIVLNTGLDCDEVFKEDPCSSCRLCIDSCPTGAINENRTIDVRKCIAYITIESKAPAPDEIVSELEGRVFGCDRCQEACPWNKKARLHNNPEFEISHELKEMTATDWQNLTEVQYNRIFKKSPIARRKYKLFMRNVTNVTNMSF
jgi:epoxyqueuosine reductase